MLCYSTASLPDRFSASDIATALLPSPFRGVEYVVKPHDLARAYDASYWHGFRTELETRGLSVRNVQLGHPFLLGPIAHAPGLSSLAPAGPAGRARRVEAALAAARIAVSLGSQYLTITTGLPERAGDFNVQEQNFFASLTRIVTEKPKGLKIAIEQEPEHVIHRADQMLALCRAFEGDVFANYDVGHGVVAGENPAQAVRVLGGYVSNLHLEDIKGRTHKHLMFGDGDVDFRALFKTLGEIRYAGDVTMDLYPFKDEPRITLHRCASFLSSVTSTSGITF